MKKLIGMAFAMSGGLALLGLGSPMASALSTPDVAAPQFEAAMAGISRVHYNGRCGYHCGNYFYPRWGACVRCCNYTGCWRLCDVN